MLGNDFKMAIAMLRSQKWRSGLAIFSTVVFVVSIATIIGLGASVKHQINTQSKRAGQDLVTVRPGQPFRLNNGQAADINLTYGLGFGAGSLSGHDLKLVKESNGVGQVSAVNFVAGSFKTEEQEYLNGSIFGVEDSFRSLINQDLDFGTFFSPLDDTSHQVVIGRTIAEELFKENVPLGRSLSIRGQNFVVKGVFQTFQPNTLVLGSDFNRAIFIPYQTSLEISDGSNQIVQILAKPAKPGQSESLAKDIKERLFKSHFGQNDLSVLSQKQSAAFSKQVVDKIIAFIAGIATIALLAAGIGIMNTMLLSVTERTREIGIRKALGATNRQLLRLFWFEALVLSVTGAVLGIIGALLANYFLHILTNLKPLVSWQALILPSIMAIALGILFGIIPALKASKKDPIDSLRHEA